MRIRDGSSWRELPPHKTVALLGYLAAHSGWLSRIELATLFWPEADQRRALRNLRTLLARAKREVGPDALEIETKRVRWDVACDVHEFLASVRSGRWQDALELHQGPLMEGASVADAGGFATWLEEERRQVADLHREAGVQRVRELQRAGRRLDALGLADSLLTAHGDDEQIVVLAMEAQADAERPADALRAYRAFAEHIRAELGLEPTRATAALAEAIQSGEWSSGAAERSPPRPPTTFATMVGREAEMARLSDLLSEPRARLVTIIGVGGVGKTLLALRTAEHLASRYRHGVRIAYLEGATTSHEVVQRIAGALGAVLPDHAEPIAELGRRLADREILLVLDNFEQALAAAPAVERLLSACPHVDALVTSRQSLSVPAERRFPLDGLAVPDPDAPAQRALDYGAVRCLVEQIRYVRPEFVADARTTASLVSIARAVGGLPLGLELAASWARAITVEEIAVEIQAGLDFLDASSAASDAAAARGIRATLARSWSMLAPVQQEALARLSVFRGGFGREGAAEVAGASIGLLAGLIDRSMLAPPVDGRYRMHPLVRAFVAEHLAEDPERRGEARDRHADYFVDLLASVEADMGTPQEAQTRRRLAPERDNLHAALLHALETSRVDAALRLSTAVRWVHALFGRLQEQREVLTRALSLPGARDEAVRAEAVHLLSAKALADGDLDEARRAIEAGLGASGRAASAGTTVKMWNDLALIARDRGELGRARELLERCVAHGEEMRDRARYAYMLNNFGSVERMDGRFDHARAWHEEALAIGRELDDGPAIGYALNGLAAVARDAGDIAGAERTFLESVAVTRRRQVTSPAVIALHGLARIASSCGRFGEARSLHVEALVIEHESGLKRFRDRSLDAVAATLAEHGEPLPALRLWAAADRLRQDRGARLPPTEIAQRSLARAAAASQVSEAAATAAMVAGRGLDADRAHAAALSALQGDAARSGDTF